MTSNIAGILTVSLAAVTANYRQLAARAPGSQIAAAVKADAYGLGLAQVAPALARAGCSFFYVAHIEEGLSLRQLLPQAEIAVLHGIPAKDVALARQHRLLPVLCSWPDILAWQHQAGETSAACPVIIHLDTGMNRLGLSAAETAQLAERSEVLSGLEVKFWLSHLACADEPQHPFNVEQLAELTRRIKKLPSAPVSFANSSGIFLGSRYHFEQVRPGCALYGINPIVPNPNPMQAVARLEAPVIQLRTLQPGEAVGYSVSWHSKRLGKVAVLPVGYADGFLRSLGNRGQVFFGTRAAPIVGRVSMDLITVDVTDVPDQDCQPGAYAELFGREQGVDAVAAAAGTIGYEILTGLGSRYRRVYEEDDVGHQSVRAARTHPD